LTLIKEKVFPFKNFPCFKGLQNLSGHERSFVHGFVDGKEVIALRGRIHLNEDPGNTEIFRQVRLQIEILMQLGVKKLILTCAVGALPKGNRMDPDLNIGNIIVINSFVTLFAPRMPLWAGEFVSPEDTLSENLFNIAHPFKLFQEKSNIKRGAYAMVMGPYFEGRRKDKEILAHLGANVVGMSILPEACVAALYGCEVLPIGFITNSAQEVHSHEENLRRAKESSREMGKFLRGIINKI
jgi:purine nucleoside phosphorylase